MQTTYCAAAARRMFPNTIYTVQHRNANWRNLAGCQDLHDIFVVSISSWDENINSNFWQIAMSFFACYCSFAIVVFFLLFVVCCLLYYYVCIYLTRHWTTDLPKTLLAASPLLVRLAPLAGCESDAISDNNGNYSFLHPLSPCVAGPSIDSSQTVSVQVLVGPPRFWCHLSQNLASNKVCTTAVVGDEKGALISEGNALW